MGVKINMVGGISDTKATQRGIPGTSTRYWLAKSAMSVCMRVCNVVSPIQSNRHVGSKSVGPLEGRLAAHHQLLTESNEGLEEPAQVLPALLPTYTFYRT